MIAQNPNVSSITLTVKAAAAEIIHLETQVTHEMVN